ncbi:hypothetical protein [Streptomyces sp. SID3343]|uniref:hypothetical protein n=1 Tax=Streptomyces sp. SID3343 TaxID=2690260 RepID=UPI00136B2C4C|nr:hypothetical protein [Streptomyces sp. SID3343]MYV98369.1 hypothetical protein [Streptomyces sp. SID3343]
MGLLLRTDAPGVWRSAVEHAARLLAPTWCAEQPAAADADLGTLAMTLLALAREHDRVADAVPLDAVRAALEDCTGYGGEPIGLRARIDAALKAGGHERDDPLWHLRIRLAYQWEPMEPMSDIEPAPSLMRDAVDRIRRALGALDEASVAELPTAPTPTGALRVAVAGAVRVVITTGATGAMFPILCGTCARGDAGVLAVGGTDVTYTCAAGHTGVDRRLAAVRVRNAVAFVDAGPAGIIGDLLVSGVAAPEDTDPRPGLFSPPSGYVDGLRPEVDDALMRALRDPRIN